MEEVTEFKYLGTILCKHGSMEGEIREITVKGRQVMCALEIIMKGRNVSTEVKKARRNSVILLSLLYASETDMECSTAITNMSCGNELYVGCLWCGKVG